MSEIEDVEGEMVEFEPIELVLPTAEVVGVACGSGESVGVYTKTEHIAAVEPCGKWFEEYSTRKRNGKSYEEEEADMERRAAELALVDDGDDWVMEPESDELLRAKPADLQKLDLYAILGLSKLRYRATEEEITRAHKAKILKHHPDKKMNAGINADDNFFKCIQKAFDVLMDPKRRRSFDSADPEFDDSFPEYKDPAKLKKTAKFFQAWGPVIERNSRWFEKKVPLLGDMDSTDEYVIDLYNMWLEGTSWREFSWYDKDDKDSNANRDQKRQIERENKAERKKRKDAENTRMRELVEACKKSDPRVKRIKENQKKAKEEARLARSAGKREAEEAAAKAKAEEEAIAKAKAEEEAKAASAKKLDKDAAKKLQAKQRKTLRRFAKTDNYWGEADTAAAMAMVEKVIDKISIEDLVQLNELLAKENTKANVEKYL